MKESKLSEVLGWLKGGVKIEGEKLKVVDEKALRDNISKVIFEAVFGDEETKAAGRWLIFEAAQALGIRPASIHDFYLARGRGEAPLDFTVPAINLRMLAYDSARAVFRAAKKIEAGGLFFFICPKEKRCTHPQHLTYF